MASVANRSCELKSARQLVANTLTFLGYEPEWQDIFGTEEGDLRAMLRRRLARRGFDVSSVMEARKVVAALSAALVNSTVQAALLGTAERAAAVGVVSASVVTLTKGALRAMTLTRCTTTTAMVLLPM